MFAGEQIQKELEGEMVRRVSRATIVKALKAQTATISALFKDAVEKAKMIGELQESNNLLKSQVSSLQNDHADLKEVVRKQGILVQEHEEILGSGKIEKLFQRVDILEAKMSEIEEAISIGFQEASDDRMQIREDADKNFSQVRADISKFGDITDNLDSRASALEARMKDLGYVCKDGVFRIQAERVAVGANDSPITDLLKDLRTTLTVTTESIRTEMGEHHDMLANFAPKVKLIPEAHETAMANKRLFEDLGFGEEGAETGILEQFADMKDDMNDIKNSLLEKCDISKMHETIELKYDEIVDHLQEAISAAVEDEDEYKKVTEELKEMCKNLMMNKADKMALIEVNERLAMNKLIKEEMLTLEGQLNNKVDKNDVNAIMTQHDAGDKSQMMEVITTMAKRLERSIGRRLEKYEQQSGGNAAYGGGGYGDQKNPAFTRATSPSLTATGNTIGGGSSTKSRLQRAVAIISGPVMGPGGPSLGGGFSVKMPKRAATSRGKRLPKIGIPNNQSR